MGWNGVVLLEMFEMLEMLEMFEGLSSLSYIVFVQFLVSSFFFLVSSLTRRGVRGVRSCVGDLGARSMSNEYTYR